MKTRLLLAAALTMAAPSAFAQVAQPPAALPPVAEPMPQVQHVPAGYSMFDFDRTSPNDTRVEFSRTVVTSPARVARAERLVDLVNAGQCARAEMIAREEGDTRLARRIETVCARND